MIYTLPIRTEDGQESSVATDDAISAEVAISRLLAEMPERAIVDKGRPKTATVEEGADVPSAAAELSSGAVGRVAIRGKDLPGLVSELDAIDGRSLDFGTTTNPKGETIFFVRLRDADRAERALRKIYRWLNNLLAGEKSLKTDDLLDACDEIESALGGNPLPPGERLTPGRAPTPEELVS